MQLSKKLSQANLEKEPELELQLMRLVKDSSQKNTYPKKCITDFINLLCEHFSMQVEVLIEYREQVSTIYKKTVDENIKSKEDMYDSIKDNNIVKDIEDIFDAKIDKDNISKL